MYMYVIDNKLYSMLRHDLGPTFGRANLLSKTRFLFIVTVTWIGYIYGIIATSGSLRSRDPERV